MQIICPECRFAREVDESRIPARSQVATCPKCQTKFKFRDLPEPEFLIEEPEPEAAPEPIAPPKPVAEPVAEPAPRAMAEPEAPASAPLEPEEENPAAPVLRKLRRSAEPRQGSLMETGDEEETGEKPDRAFPGLPDTDDDSGDALWRRLHSMTPPDKPRDVHRDAPEPEGDDARQPVPGWTGEFNEDFPDPMQGEFADDEEEMPGTGMQVPPPFEQLDRYGFFRGLFLTVKLVILSPRLFFSVMPVGNGLSKPLTFAILVAMVQSLAQLAWGTAGLMPSLDMTAQGLEAAPYNGTNGLFELLFTPAFVALSIFVIAGFYHAILSALKAGNKGFEGSFRAVAYAYAPILTGVIPMPAVEMMAAWMFLYAVWSLVLTAIGLKHIHNTSYMKVVPVLLIPLLLGMIVALILLQSQLATV